MELIPAIDIIDGQCVRLKQGDYSQKTIYGNNPAQVAKQFEDCGIKYLHIVDLDGAKQSSPRNLKILEEVASCTKLNIEWGGGIKSSQSVKDVLNAGAGSAICGSIAIDNPLLFKEWLQHWGGEKIVLGADLRDGKVSTHGWLKDSQITVCQIIESFKEDGLKRVICTDISKDGMLLGPNFELYKELTRKFPMLNFTLSGGVRNISDLNIAKEIGLHSAIIGKAFYEGYITLKDLEQWLQKE